MSTVTVPRDVTTQEVAEALHNSLDPHYRVLPGMRMPVSPLFGKPQASEPNLIMVTANPLVRAQVRVTSRAGRTDLQITPGGLSVDRVVNAIGIARKVRQALLNWPSLDVRKGP